MTRSAIRLLWAGPAAALGIVLTGCGDNGSSTSHHTPMTSSPAATSASATPIPTPSSEAVAGGIPDDFPLAEGLDSDGDTTVTAPRHGVKGIRLERSCWGETWPGAAVDRLVVQQLGPELEVTRELVLYRDAATAAAVGRQVGMKAGRCHRLPATSQGAAMEVTMLGHDPSGAAHTDASFAETLAGGQPGGSVLVFTRVGRAVLAVEDSGEWTRDSAVDGARHVERADRVLVARMSQLDRD